MKNTGTLFLLVALAIALVIAQPIIVIWALNTIFPALAIETTIETWLAVMILTITLFHKEIKSISNK